MLDYSKVEQMFNLCLTSIFMQRALKVVNIFILKSALCVSNIVRCDHPFPLPHYSFVFLLVTVNVKLEEATKSPCEPETSTCHQSHILQHIFYVQSIPNKVCWNFWQSWPVDCLNETELEGRLGKGRI